MFSRSIRICFALGWAALLTAAAPVGAWAEKKPAGSQPHPPTYYLPKLLPSIADAAQKIQFLAPHIRYGSYNGADRANVDSNGVQMFFSQSGVNQSTQYFWSWTGGYNAPVSTPYHYSATFSILYSQLSSLRYADGFVYVCARSNDCEMLTTPDVPQDHMLMDALLTLAVAGGNANVSVVDMAWETLSAHELRKLKLNDARQIKFVDANTPGAEAGVQPGDIITAIDGVPYHQNLYGEMADKCLKTHPTGCSAHMNLLRNGAPVGVDVKIRPAFTAEEAERLQAAAAALAARNGAPPQPAPAPQPASPKLGVRGHNLSPEEATAAKLAAARGVYVDEVEHGAVAESMQVKSGDILLEINGTPVANTDELRQALHAGPVANATVWRDGARLRLMAKEEL